MREQRVGETKELGSRVGARAQHGDGNGKGVQPHVEIRASLYGRQVVGVTIYRLMSIPTIPSFMPAQGRSAVRGTFSLEESLARGLPMVAHGNMPVFKPTCEIDIFMTSSTSHATGGKCTAKNSLHLASYLINIFYFMRFKALASIVDFSYCAKGKL
jgi:hypothetical protein